MFISRKRRLAVVLGSLLLSPLARAAPATDLSEDDFKLYHQYLEAAQEPRLERLKPEQRVAAVARTLKVPPGKLQAVVDKGTQFPTLEALGKRCEESIRQSTAGTALEGRLDEVRVDVRDEHVVTYLSWVASDLSQLEEEAALMAVKARKAAPITADVRLWAEDPANKQHRVFDGLISGEAAGRFHEERIADFAKTRYIKAFQTAKIDRPQE